jgi:hypothetical protein
MKIGTNIMAQTSDQFQKLHTLFCSRYAWSKPQANWALKMTVEECLKAARCCHAVRLKPYEAYWRRSFQK